MADDQTSGAASTETSETTSTTETVDNSTTAGSAAEQAQTNKQDDATSKLLAQLEADRDKWKAQARKHEDRARTNAQAVTQAQTLEQQVEGMRQALADRDVRDVERNQRLALTRVEAKIAEAGVKPGDVADLLALVDPLRLLADGEPDEDAIIKVAASIARNNGRPAPDNDQGRANGVLPPNMNDLIRRAAGISR